MEKDTPVICYHLPGTEPAPLIEEPEETDTESPEGETVNPETGQPEGTAAEPGTPQTAENAVQPEEWQSEQMPEQPPETGQ